VDVFDALSSPRVYKPAWPLEKVQDHMLEQRGKHFDPHLVDILFDNLDAIVEIREQYKDEFHEPTH
jgi:response regulator RpfG family c-di-GMP phosphodiesterase